MSLLWDASTLRRLRSRLGRSHPAAARRAAVLRAWRRAVWWGKLTFALTILLGLPMIWLAGGVYLWRWVPIESSAGLAAVFWLVAARIIYHCAKNISVRVPPEILLLAPCGENEAIARRRTRRELLKLWLGALALAFWAAVCFARRGEFSWPRCAGAAGLLWAHILMVAAAMPRFAPWLLREWHKYYPRGQSPARLRRGLITLFTMLFIGLTAAQFALGESARLEQLGKALALVLPPAGFLQWAAHPQAFPYWQSALTLLLIWPALPVLRQWRKSWCELPFITTPVSWYWSANHEEEEDAYSEAPVDLPAPPADPRAALRAHLGSKRWDADSYLLPTVPPLTLRSFLPPPRHLLCGLAAVAVGVLSGQGLGALIGWVWLLVPSVSFGTLPWLYSLWRFDHATLGRIALHEWLPIPARPMWETVARHQHRGALSCIGGAALLCLAGGIVTWLASLVPPLWSWHYPLKFSPPAIAGIAFTACTGIAFAIRAAAPMRFAVQLLPKDRLTFTTRLAGIFPGMLNLGSLLAIVVSACIFMDPFFNSRPLTTEFHLLPALAFLAASEILRILAARLFLWLWAHGRRR